MKRVLILAFFSLISILTIPLESRAEIADQVLLYNGDHFSGEIVRMEDGLLTIRIAYVPTETVQIRWQDVSCINSDRKLSFVLGEDTVTGSAVCAEVGRIRIINEKLGTLNTLALTDLRAINPSIYSGIFNFGGTLASGNTNTKGANLSTRFQVRTKRHRFTVEGKFNYAESEGTTTARNSTGSIKYDNFATEKIYTYAQSLVERDDFQNLNLRSTQGLGMGYQFYDQRNKNLFAEAGISFLNEDYIAKEDRQSASGRWSVGLNYDVIPDKVKLFHFQEGYYTPDSDAWYIRTEQGFRMPLIGNISVNLEVDWRFNSKPDPDKRKADIYIILGLTYQYAYW
jgi:putative salt-induced outer membrane protein YdiY